MRQVRVEREDEMYLVSSLSSQSGTGKGIRIGVGLVIKSRGQQLA